MKPSNITYLLGAGASAKRMPMVKDMFSFFSRVPNTLSKPLNTVKLSRRGAECDGKEVVRELELYSDSLARIVQAHFSIDTYAKKLFFSGKDDELRKLKAFISIFFTIEQLSMGNDPRYDAFFASVLEKVEERIVFPENISIVSWNYDLQVYNSIEDICGFTDKSSTVNMIGDNVFLGNSSKKYVKLNGMAGVGYNTKNASQSSEVVPNYNFEKFRISSNERNAFLIELGQYWLDMVYNASSKVPLIEFAWEDTAYRKSKIEEAIDHFKNASTLVVIGYSFPTFNKKVDQLLFSHLPDICTIYVQCGENRTDEVISKLRLMVPSNDTKDHRREFIPIYQTNEFHIPEEFFL